MTNDQIRIFSLGDTALTVEFGNTISASINDKAIHLSENLEQNPFPGFIETVPAYGSVTIFYDVLEVSRSFPDFATAFDAVRSFATERLNSIDTNHKQSSRNIEIPVHFDNDAALDLNHVAELHGLSSERVIEIFISSLYRVFMLGFLPGFTYMGEVAEEIATPRKDTPRTVVPKGSVGIAGRQTGIYSLESPGGWQIIGRTDVEMFTPDAEEPSFLRPGDQVRFIAIQ